MKPHYIRNCCGCSIEISDKDILHNPEIVPIGLMAINVSGTDLYFYFTHDIKECGTTFAVSQKDLKHLIDEDIPDDIMFKTEKCQGHCVNINSAAECDNECVNAPFRRLLIRLIENRRK